MIVYTADPWVSALPVLRYRAAASLAGITVMHGNDNHSVDLSRIEQADLVLIQRDFPRFTRTWREILLAARQLGKPIVYETDDLLFDLPSDHPSYQDLSLYTIPMMTAIQEADLVTTSTEFLAGRLRSLQPNLQVLPNYLNDQLWSLREPQEAVSKDRLTIGYMGGKTHLGDLSSITSVLQKIIQHYSERVTLRFWGCQPPTGLLRHPCVDWTPMNMLDYALFTAYFKRQHIDIAIAPLEDNILNQAKSPIKFLEYSALGAAGIYSDQPGYASILQHGENGYLAANLEDWEACLVDLIENPHKRWRMAMAAQETVRKDWLLSGHAHLWTQTYQNIHPSPNDSPVKLERTLELVCKSQDWILSLEAERSRSTHENDNCQQALYNMHEHLNATLADLHAAQNQVDALNDALKEEIEVHKEQVALMQAEKHGVEIELQNTRTELGQLQSALDEIQNNRTWKMLQLIQRFRLWIIPAHSRREKLLKKLGVLSNK